jgi:nitrogen fixation NifU-like protein
VNRQEAIELLLDHYESPRNREKQADADVVMPGGNPGCGDVVTIYLKVDRDADRVGRVTFEGQGCTISQAAASIVTELVDGLPLSEIEGMDYHAIVDVIGEEVAQTRPRCATLALGTLKAAIKKYRQDRLRESVGEAPLPDPTFDHFEI